MFFVRSHVPDAIVSSLFSARACPFLLKKMKDDGHGHFTPDNYSFKLIKTLIHWNKVQESITGCP